MLDKNITYEVFCEGDPNPIGEIKGGIYYNFYGQYEHEVRDNYLFNNDQKFGVISNSDNGLILTRFENDTVFSIREKK